MTETRKKITLPYLFKKVEDKQPITWLTCYDYPTAYLQEQAGIEMILVGDSLGMTMLGFDSTLPVKMDDMIRHAQAVRRGAPTAFVVGDMPYMTYQDSVENAIRNAGRFMSEAGCDAIKLEGGAAMANRIKGIVDAGMNSSRSPSSTERVLLISTLVRRSLMRELSSTYERIWWPQPISDLDAEKLASLGELTAGIAHEIQNPLNFVNNFSELSVDLAKDIQEEMHKPEIDQAYVDELLTDLSQNQQKINHHGKRAAAIVSGMLQHARATTAASMGLASKGRNPPCWLQSSSRARSVSCALITRKPCFSSG